MCITEEEFREQRKEAIEVLKGFKELEYSFQMDSKRIDKKTFKTWKHTDEKHKMKKNIVIFCLRKECLMIFS